MLNCELHNNKNHRMTKVYWFFQRNNNNKTYLNAKHYNFLNSSISHQGPLSFVFQAPPAFIPLLCCLIRLFGSTVNPMYVRPLNFSFNEYSK